MTRNLFNKAKQPQPKTGKPAAQNRATGKTALPRHIDKAARDVINITQELVKCLTAENQALEKADVSRFLTLQEYKIEITHRYNDAMQALLGRKDELEGLSVERKQELGDVYKKFTALTQENLVCIERMKNSVERLNGHIMNSARRHADKKGVNYSGRGHIQKETKSLSMGINRSA